MARDFEDYCWKDIVNPEILEIYEPYRRKLFVGPKPAVLAIDLYNKAYEGGNRPVIEVASILFWSKNAPMIARC